MSRRLSNPASSLVRAAQNILERRVQTSSQELGLQQSRFFVRTIIWLLLGTTGAAVAWLAYAKTDEVVVAPGKLEPVGEVKTIQMPVGGVLKDIPVKDGQKVQEGQILLRLDNEAAIDAEDSIRKSIKEKSEQLGLKKLELEKYVAMNLGQQKSFSASLSVEKDVLSRYKQLQMSGAAAQLQYLTQLNKVQEVLGELNRLKDDRLRQAALLEQDIRGIRAELAEMRGKLTQSSVNARYQFVKSPVDGVVFDLKPKAPGFVAEGSEPVMKIVPFSLLQARVEIPSEDIGFVKLGKPADISIDSFPSTDYGVLEGVISFVGSDALPPDQLKQFYKFPAIISLSSQKLNAKGGPPLPLQVGMSVTANIKLRKVSYLQLLIGSLGKKVDSLREK